MVKKTLFSRLNQPVQPVLALILIGLVGIGGISALVLRSSQKATSSPQQNRSQAVVIPTPLPTSKSTVPPTPVPHTTYASDNLGISFTYPIQVEALKFFTKEIGNKIYLYDNYSKESFNQPFSGTDAEFLKTIASGAKYVEVFHKDPADSLTEAIKKQFLQGYSLENCPIVPANLAKSSLNPARQYEQITTPIIPGSTMAEKLAEEKLCPPTYTDNRRAGILYFMMDPNHTDKFFFIKIGQDNILSGVGGGTWDATIKVLQ
jgi:hypothetical protein